MLADALTLGLLGVLAALFVADVVRPARAFPKIRRWRFDGLVATLVYFGLAFTLPVMWDGWFGEHRLLDLTGLGMFGGAVVGMLGYQLVAYWWHRALHAVPFLWRIHQMHHSAERIDAFGANYFHPLDMVGWLGVQSFALVMVFGVTADAAIIAGVTSNVIALLGHANIRTPAWLGYLIQRPENHASHHERGVHANNYGDISLWDQVFGTWRNPKTWDKVGGYYDGASRRIGDMLIGRDVTETPEARAAASSRLHPAQSGSYAQ